MFKVFRKMLVLTAFFIGTLSPSDVWGNEGEQTCNKPTGPWKESCYELTNSSQQKSCSEKDRCKPVLIEETKKCQLYEGIRCKNSYSYATSISPYTWPVDEPTPKLEVDVYGNLKKQ
jgi:hypothetical protein